jgi:hypothetical protein
LLLGIIVRKRADVQCGIVIAERAIARAAIEDRRSAVTRLKLGRIELHWNSGGSITRKPTRWTAPAPTWQRNLSAACGARRSGTINKAAGALAQGTPVHWTVGSGTMLGSVAASGTMKIGVVADAALTGSHSQREA